RNMNIAIDDRAPYTAVAPHVYMREQDAVVDFAERVHPDVGRQDTVPHRASGDDATGGNDRVQCSPSAARFSKDELCRGILALMRANGPIGVVEVEHRGYRDDVHIGFVVRLKGAYIA